MEMYVNRNILMKLVIVLMLILFNINCFCQEPISDNKRWVPFTGCSIDGREIITLANYRNSIYLGGDFTGINGQITKAIARFNNSVCEPIGSGTDNNGIVGSMLVCDNILYVGGYFASIGGKQVNNIARWDNKHWEDLGDGVSMRLDSKSGFAMVASILSYNNELYIGGQFDSSGNKRLNNIAKWNGNSWKQIEGGVKGRVDGFHPRIDCMAIFNGDLYVAGSFDSAGNIPANSIAKWNGKNWAVLAGGVTIHEGVCVSTLCVYQGELYVGGRFDTVDGKPVQNIAKWNGKEWKRVGDGIAGLQFGSDYVWVWALQVYNGKLYAGGEFTSAGGKPAYNVACWDGSQWKNAGDGMSPGRVDNLYVDNGIMYAVGMTYNPAYPMILKWVNN
jgi:hypothetical protein